MYTPFKLWVDTTTLIHFNRQRMLYIPFKLWVLTTNHRNNRPFLMLYIPFKLNHVPWVVYTHVQYKKGIQWVELNPEIISPCLFMGHYVLYNQHHRDYSRCNYIEVFNISKNYYGTNINGKLMISKNIFKIWIKSLWFILPPWIFLQHPYL